MAKGKRARALFRNGTLVVRKAGAKGMGVFARKPIARGDVIERVPVIVISKDAIFDYWSEVSEYVFKWEGDRYAIALGFGSLYNHSFDPSAYYEADGERALAFTALRDIAKGEEITINYTGDSDDPADLWFKNRG